MPLIVPTFLSTASYFFTKGATYFSFKRKINRLEDNKILFLQIIRVFSPLLQMSSTSPDTIQIQKSHPGRWLFYVWLLHMDCPRHRFALLVPPHSFATAHRRSSDRLSFVVEPLPRGSNHKHNSNTKKPPGKVAFLYLAASHGFEPRLTESESAVLPLDDEAIEREYLYRNPLPMSRDFIKKI